MLSYITRCERGAWAKKSKVAVLQELAVVDRPHGQPGGRVDRHGHHDRLLTVKLGVLAGDVVVSPASVSNHPDHRPHLDLVEELCSGRAMTRNGGID